MTHHEDTEAVHGEDLCAVARTGNTCKEGNQTDKKKKNSQQCTSTQHMEIRESTLAYINSMSGQPITANKLIAILLKWCFETDIFI